MKNDQRSGRATSPAIAGHFNVIFRGLFLFVEQPDHFDVFVTNMDTDHVYRAGRFLWETDLEHDGLASVYTLRGVDPGKQSICNASLVCTHCKVRSDITDADVCAVIQLPKPAAIKC